VVPKTQRNVLPSSSKDKQFALLGLLGPDVEGTMFLLSAEDHSSNDTALHLE